MSIQTSHATRRAKTASAIEERLTVHIRVNALPVPTREHRFHPTRMWRFDFAWPDLKIAAECEGGVWVNGAHNRGAHFTSDCEKYNAATELGWRVFRFTGDQVVNGAAIDTLQRVIKDALWREPTKKISTPTGLRQITGDHHAERIESLDT